MLCTDFKKSHIADDRKQNKDKDMIDLRLGDCLEVMKTIEDNSIDAIICDLPYGTTQNKWDSIIPFDLLWLQYERVIKDNGAIVLTAQQPFTSALIMSNPKIYKYNWVYQKNKSTGFLNAKRQPLNDYEDICVFYKKQCTYNPQMTVAEKIYKRGEVKRKKSDCYGNEKDFKQVETGLRYPKRIQYFNNNKTQEQKHSTQKPLELLEYLVKTYTNENDTILDNTMGSGTTMVACKKLGRNGIGIEKEEKYFKIAQERVNSFAQE